MKTLEELMGVANKRAAPAASDRFLARYGLARNPFPTARTILPEVIYNQQSALTAFASKIADVLQDGSPQKRSLSLLGGNGSGKTHFLRHCQYLINNHQAQDRRQLVVVEFLAGTSSIASLLREVLRRTDDLVKEAGSLDLLGAIIDGMKDETDYGTISLVELRSVLRLLYRSTRASFAPPDKDQMVGYDQLRELSKKWLSGATLTATERRYLGVFSRLGTASLMARAISELLALGREKGALAGVVICLDEIESLFTGQNTTSKVQQFLQDLRFLFDEAVKPDHGFSLLILSASTQTGALRLRDFNYPLYQRLGFENDSRQSLAAINGLDEVIDFAKTYIDYEQKRSKVKPTRKEPLLDQDDFIDAYEKATVALKNSPFRTSSVSQAQLLEALHEIVQVKRATYA